MRIVSLHRQVTFEMHHVFLDFLPQSGDIVIVDKNTLHLIMKVRRIVEPFAYEHRLVVRSSPILKS